MILFKNNKSQKDIQEIKLFNKIIEYYSIFNLVKELM